jgi:hypothetical protein
METNSFLFLNLIRYCKYDRPVRPGYDPPLVPPARHNLAHVETQDKGQGDPAHNKQLNKGQGDPAHNKQLNKGQGDPAHNKQLNKG